MLLIIMTILILLKIKISLTPYLLCYNITVNSVRGKRKINLVSTVKVVKLTLQDVLYIPSSTKNIISLAKIVDGTGYNWVSSQKRIEITKGNQIVATANREGNFFWLHSHKFRSPAVFNVERVSESAEIRKSEWHMLH